MHVEDAKGAGDDAAAARLFAGPGEMRARCRALDWAATPLGPVSGWPQSLRTAAGTVLASAFPAIVLWGPELVQIYNDGYVPFLGVKHPWGLGLPTRVCWPEAWDFNAPIYARVQAGETVSFSDQLYRLERSGPGRPADDVYITISYSPVPGEAGEAGGVLVLLWDTTDQVAGRRAAAALAESEARLRVALDAGGLGTWHWDLDDDTASFDAHVRELFAFGGDEPWDRVDVLASRVHPADAQRVSAALFGAMDPAGDGRYHAEYRVVRPDGSERWILAAGRMLLDADGRPARLVGTVQDLTARKAMETELRDARAAAESAAEELAAQVEEAQTLAEELEQANEELRQSNGALEAARASLEESYEQLADQQAELELGNAQLQESAAELEAQARALDEANAALRTSEARFRNVLEQAPVAVAVMEGPDHVYTIVSPRYAETPGGGRPLLGLPLSKAFPEIANQGFPERVDHVYRTGEPYSAPGRRVMLDRDRDGVLEEYYFDIGYQPLRDRSGAVYAVASVAIDVTAQVRARQQVESARLAEEHARQSLARTFEQAPVAIAVLDGPEHVFSLANPFYLALLGGRDVLGLPIRDALPELEGQGIFELISEVFHTGRTIRAEERRVRLVRGEGDGAPEERVFNFTYQPLRDRDGAVQAVTVAAVDVTEQARGRELAEAANRAKAEFLANMSHELRTPLNAIAGYADLMLLGLRGTLGDQQRSDVERMRKSGQHLLSLINDILNFAKIEAGQLQYQREAVPVGSLLADLEALVMPQVAQRGLSYETVSGHDGATVWADAEKTRQILLNLVTNAIKFTEPGGRIEVSFEALRQGVCIHVRDTGRGIPAEQQGRIFDPFVQVDRHLTAESQQGVGLGLSISRDLARAMGGDLTVESVPGEGSDFALWLPAHAGS